MNDEITRLDIADFRSLGYLQELNRRFLHPLGLALEVIVEDDGTETLGGVWDYRNDPEGIRYDNADGHLAVRARWIDNAWQLREADRISRLGYMVQPAETSEGGT